MIIIRKRDACISLFLMCSFVSKSNEQNITPTESTFSDVISTVPILLRLPWKITNKSIITLEGSQIIRCYSQRYWSSWVRRRNTGDSRSYYSRKESQSVSELFYDRWTDTGGKSPFGERIIKKPKIKTVWKRSDEFSTVWREKCGRKGGRERWKKHRNVSILVLQIFRRNTCPSAEKNYGYLWKGIWMQRW